MEKIMLISDIHGNYDALKTILEKEEYDKLWVLGDLVDYGPEPELVIDLIKKEADIVIKGNHDHAAAYGVDCRCGPKTRELSYYTRKEITLKKLGKNDIIYLQSLESKAIIKDKGLFHGSPEDPLYGYLYPWLSFKEVCKALKGEYIPDENTCKTDYAIVMIGHTHYQFSYRLGNTLLVNPGSLGQPRDGDWRAGYSLIYFDGEMIQQLAHKRRTYDVEKTIKKLEHFVRDKNHLMMLKSILLNGRV